MERYNEKWECQTPIHKRLTDDEVETFIKTLIPVVFKILFSDYEDPIYKTTKVCLIRPFFSETAPPISMKLGIHSTHSLKMVLK